MPWSDYANVQADRGIRCPHMPEDMFAHCVARILMEKYPDDRWMIFLSSNKVGMLTHAMLNKLRCYTHF